MKAAFKAASGLDWSPAVAIPQSPPAADVSGDLDQKIKDQGDKIRTLKEQKAAKVNNSLQSAAPRLLTADLYF